MQTTVTVSSRGRQLPKRDTRLQVPLALSGDAGEAEHSKSVRHWELQEQNKRRPTEAKVPNRNSHERKAMMGNCGQTELVAVIAAFGPAKQMSQPKGA